MDWFIDFIIAYGSSLSYLVIAGALLVTSVGFPLPEDIILLAAGFITARGYTNLYLMIIVTMVSILGGDLIMYLLGRRFGEGIFKMRFFRRIFTPTRVEKIRHFYERHGRKTVFICRFTPVLRAGSYLLAGASRMQVIRFIMMDFIAALISVPVLVWLGYLFTSRIKEIAELITRTKIVLVLLIALIVLVVLLYRRIRKRRTKSEERKATLSSILT